MQNSINCPAHAVTPGHYHAGRKTALSCGKTLWIPIFHDFEVAPSFLAQHSGAFTRPRLKRIFSDRLHRSPFPASPQPSDSQFLPCLPCPLLMQQCASSGPGSPIEIGCHLCFSISHSAVSFSLLLGSPSNGFFSECLDTAASWQHCIDYNTTSAGLSPLTLQPTCLEDRFLPQQSQESKAASFSPRFSTLVEPTQRSDDLYGHRRTTNKTPTRHPRNACISW